MFDQIKIIDYRNACFQGFLLDGAYDRLGAFLTQDFLFCLANWKKGVISGPCFVIFPNQKIFYGDLYDDKPDGICCYQMGKQCQFYCIYDNGKMLKTCLAVFPYLGCVLQIQLDDQQNVIKSIENYYDNNQQKWQVIQKITGIQVPQYIKSINKYMNQSFIGKSRIIEDVIGDQHFYGFRGEGLGMKFYRKQFQIASMGYYDQDKVLKYIGKRIINQQKKVRQEGIYQKPQTLMRYLQRPPILRKTYRNFFRQSINFQNKFIHFPALQKIQNQLNILRQKVKDSTTQKIAQQLIEHLDSYQNILPENSNNTGNRTQPLNGTSNRTQLLNQTSRDRSFLNRPRMAQQVTLDALKQQLNRSMSNKKSKGNSPYKKYNPEPAQLKYTSKTNTNKKSQIPLSKERVQNYPSSINYMRTPDRVGDRNPLMTPTRYDDYEQEPKKYEPKIRYPIQEDLRTINTKAPSRSPIRTEQKPIKYQYMEDSNPQLQDNRRNNQFKHIYQPPKFKNPTQDYSPSNYKNSSRNNQRLDKLQKLYEQTQQEKYSKYRQPTTKPYALNKGNGYKYIQQDSLDQKMGLIKPNRTVQQPKNRSRSPLYTEQDYQMSYQGKRNKYYDDKSYQGREQRRYGYFDKNR